MQQVVEAQENSGWLARLELEFAWREGRTLLARNRRLGPLVVQKPFYPEGTDLCHVYLVHPPGGVAGGDEIHLSLRLEPQAKVLLTTPGATKFYRSNAAHARVVQDFALAAGACLEWLPQENIVHSGAQSQVRSRVELADGARFFGWEIVCLGLAAAHKPFEAGLFSQALEIRRNGLPLLAERARYQAGDPLLKEIWGLNGKGVCATLVATRAGPQELRAARDYLEANPGDYLAAASLLEDGLVVRLLCDDSRLAKMIFQGLWQVLRPLSLGRPACPPRIWST